MRVRFTAYARTRLLATLEELALDSPKAAERLRQRVGTALRRLKAFPESGRLIPEFPETRYREVVVSPYRFFYRVEGRTIWIAAVWHGAQLPREPQ